MTGWIVVVPVRRGLDAKTRLGSRPDRPKLADAFVRDALEAVLATPSVAAVVVVSDDPAVGAELGLDESIVIVEQHRAGLNAGVEEAVAAASDRWPELGRAVLLGDVPALTSDALDAALRQAAGVLLGVVPDAEGTGTVLLTAAAARRLVPLFGPGSAARHIASGHVVLPADPRLRRDVDTADDLAEAVALGVGRHTTALLAGASA